jgi:hypothetical protein
VKISTERNGNPDTTALPGERKDELGCDMHRKESESV